MPILVFIEQSDSGDLKKSSIEAVCFAKKIENEIYGLSKTLVNKKSIDDLGFYGLKFFVRTNEKKEFSNQMCKVIENYSIDYVVFPKSNMSHQLAACLSVKTKFSFVNNVVSFDLGKKSKFLKSTIFSGKAFSQVKLNENHAIFILNKSSSEIVKFQESIKILEMIELKDDNSYWSSLKSVNKEKIIDEISLTEADIVVSAGRGMKAPENWKIIEKLAKTLNAATACSKPVSDMGWRPHNEHVGQTGIKISPSLYVAIGISGAIQHLAGVNNSKVILVINNDPDAPFFSVADYGIIGDAFEVVPKLTNLLEKVNG